MSPDCPHYELARKTVILGAEKLQKDEFSVAVGVVIWIYRLALVQLTPPLVDRMIPPGCTSASCRLLLPGAIAMRFTISHPAVDAILLHDAPLSVVFRTPAPLIASVLKKPSPVPR